MSQTRVSIVLPSKDGAALLDEAVRSVAAQTCKEWELLLVDDGSTDETGARMEAWAERDPRIRVVHLTPNRGLPAALNEGFRHARGDLFSWTSDDNLYAPHAIERMLEELDRDSDLDGVYADYVRFDEAGEERGIRVAPIESLPLANGVGACFLYRREVHEELQGFDESLPLAEDYDFWLRASARFRFEPLHETLYRYRDHDGSLTAKHAREIRIASWRAVERQLPALDRKLRIATWLRWARVLFRVGEDAGARRLALCALHASPRTAVKREHRETVARAVLGRRRVDRARQLWPVRSHRSLQIVAPDALGGVAGVVESLVRARPEGAAPVELCWMQAQNSAYSRRAAEGPLPVARETRVEHEWPNENLFAVLRRMRHQLSAGPGVIVANDFFGLAYAARHAAGKAVVQILHGDAELHYAQAESFEPHIDAFVAVSERICHELRERLPQRIADIHHLASGVPTAKRQRVAHKGPLQLIYTGRLEQRKGVLDLPEIDRLAVVAGADLRWTIVGSGPEEDALRRAFGKGRRVRFTGALSREETLALLPDHDVFVLPSHLEGLPLSLLEAMAAGLVPVASDLESGMREVIEPEVTGLLARPGHPEDFAASIAVLAGHRSLLERCSRGAASRIRTRHDETARAADYFGLFADLEAKSRRAGPAYRRGPSRLDRPWLPNALVRAVRGWIG